MTNDELNCRGAENHILANNVLTLYSVLPQKRQGLRHRLVVGLTELMKCYYWLCICCFFHPGGWTLISQFIMRNLQSLRDERVVSDSYREILANYSSNNRLLKIDGFNQLKEDMGFTQIRFYCFKKAVGRVFHIMTNNDAKGADVVKYFTTSDTMPAACDSFTRLPGDNSTLAVNCDKWGHPDSNKWGHSAYVMKVRIYERPIAWPSTKIYKSNRSYRCDDNENNLSLLDTWQLFVR